MTKHYKRPPVLIPNKFGKKDVIRILVLCLLLLLLLFLLE